MSNSPIVLYVFIRGGLSSPYLLLQNALFDYYFLFGQRVFKIEILSWHPRLYMAFLWMCAFTIMHLFNFFLSVVYYRIFLYNTGYFCLWNFT